MRNFVLLVTAVLVAIFMVPPTISVASATPAPAPGLVGAGHRLVLHPAPRRRDDGRDSPRGIDGPDAGEGDPHPRVLDRDHRHCRDVGLDDRQLLPDQVLEPALQGSLRAPEEGASVTELIRSDAPRRSAMAALALGGLIIGVLWFSILTVIIPLPDLSGCPDRPTAPS